MKNAFKILGFSLTVLLMSFKPIKEKKVIIIDAGHGGTDFGVVNGNAYEKEIVSNIANKIKSFNKEKDIEIILLRGKDDFTSLNSRVEKINQLNPDLVISLHVNTSNDKAANGVQAFISEQNSNYEKSRLHAQELTQIIAKKDLEINAVQKANYLLLKNSSSPAVSLELGYLSNEGDKNFLISEKGQNRIAKQILFYVNK